VGDLPPTPGQTIGPFYGYALPYSRGHELVPPGHPRAVRLHGTVFTGWGRCGTDPAGQYAFISVEPGPTAPDAAPFFAVTLFARGLLDRLFTRVYLPGDPAKLARDALLSQLSEQRRQTLLAVREGDGSLRFDIRMQGDGETVVLTFPRQAGR
jgi:protocatechuate 3,4-dioxygenase, alpha subunit